MQFYSNLRQAITAYYLRGRWLNVIYMSWQREMHIWFGAPICGWNSKRSEQIARQISSCFPVLPGNRLQYQSHGSHMLPHCRKTLEVDWPSRNKQQLA